MKPVATWMIALCAALGACGGSAAPASSMAAAQASIRAANEVGAEHNPTAALYLQYAREGYARADALSQDGKGEEAQRMLLRAQADAELAMALSRQSAARASLDTTQTPTPMLPSAMQPLTPR